MGEQILDALDLGVGLDVGHLHDQDDAPQHIDDADCAQRDRERRDGRQPSKGDDVDRPLRALVVIEILIYLNGSSRIFILGI